MHAQAAILTDVGERIGVNIQIVVENQTGDFNQTVVQPHGVNFIAIQWVNFKCDVRTTARLHKHRRNRPPEIGACHAYIPNRFKKNPHTRIIDQRIKIQNKVIINNLQQ